MSPKPCLRIPQPLDPVQGSQVNRRATPHPQPAALPREPAAAVVAVEAVVQSPAASLDLLVRFVYVGVC